jgi:hypothetical protein
VTITVKQLIKSLKKYNPDLEIIQDGVGIKAVRIWEIPDSVGASGHVHSTKLVVRLVREDEKRA